MARTRLVLLLLPILLLIAVFTIASCGGCALLSDTDRKLMASMDDRIGGLTEQLRTLNQKEDFTSLNSELEELNSTLLLIVEILPTDSDAQIGVLDTRFSQLNITLRRLVNELEGLPFNDQDVTERIISSAEQLAEEIRAMRQELDELSESAANFEQFLADHEETFRLMHEVFREFEQMMQGANQDPGADWGDD